MNRIACVLTLVLALLSTSRLAAAPPGPPAWEVPSCNRVTGIPSVTYTTDEGATLAENVLRLDPNTSTFGIAALQAPNVLLAEYNGAILRSTNAGCRWSMFADAGAPLLLLTPAEDGIAYAWSFLRGFPFVWKLDASADPRDPARQIGLPSLPSDVLVVAPYPNDPGHVRAVGADAQIYDLFDGGRWTATGNPAPTGGLSLVYFAAVDPHDLDHIVIGMSTTGVWTTSNAGVDWTQATGLSATDGPRNAFSGVISPADSAEVFVMSLDLDESDAGAPTQGRHIYRSHDGGATFAPVVDQGGDITLTNGPLLVAHPTTPGILYFTFGSRFLDPPGSFLYRYDHGIGGVTWNFTPRATGLRAIAFNPANAGVMYLGLER
jgi:hypothetical protein